MFDKITRFVSDKARLKDLFILYFLLKVEEKK